eukprot:GILJ01005501.1.p1 GENE.GILJ01005501.1~~GILJ01005501.1.p1  ORF type:complete len:244 (+),score=16.52 GILJ01005501.1:37-768(+)
METSVLRGDLSERLLGGDDENYHDAYNVPTERTRLISSPDHTLPPRTTSQPQSALYTSGPTASRSPDVRQIPPVTSTPASLSPPYPAPRPPPLFPSISVPGLSNFLPAVGTTFIPMSVIVCAGCRLGLQFSPGAYCVHCPRCGTVTAAQHLWILSCVSCRQQVMYPAGAAQVRCACGVINNASTTVSSNGSRQFYASNHQRSTTGPVHPPLPHTSNLFGAPSRPDLSRGSTGIEAENEAEARL